MNSAGGVIVTSLAVMLAACTPIPASPSASVSASASASPSSATPTPSPTPTKLTPAEQDVESAKEAVVAYWKEFDRLAANPNTPINDMDRVARGSALESARDALSSWRVGEYTLNGFTSVEHQKAERVASSKWAVTPCVDTNKSDLVDSKGKSVTGPPCRIEHKFTVIRDAGQFFVTGDKVVGTC